MHSCSATKTSASASAKVGKPWTQALSEVEYTPKVTGPGLRDSIGPDPNVALMRFLWLRKLTPSPSTGGVGTLDFLHKCFEEVGVCHTFTDLP